MKGINEYIIHIPEPLKKTIDLGSTKLYLDPSFDQTKHSNRIGDVVSVPIDSKSEIKVGDSVLIVHTILMSQIYRGKQTDSVFLLDKEKGLYRIPKDLIVMYKPQNSNKWICNGIHVLVSPIKAKKQDYKIGSLVRPDNYFNSDISCNTNGFIKQFGIVAYTNIHLINQGVKVGDKVFFTDYADYEFNLEGQIYYCMDNRDILAKIEA